MSYIDCYDIAACATALLTRADHSGETFILTGPEALTHAVIALKARGLAAMKVTIPLRACPPRSGQGTRTPRRGRR